ncbi:MAG: ABC transporter permease [Wenzhouxiangellaceae bacterium]
MSVLWLSTLKFYQRQPLQLLLALLGIAAGVAAVAAMSTVQRLATSSFEYSLDQIYGPASHEWVAADGRIDEQYYAAVRRAAGDLSLAPMVSGRVRINGQSLTLVGIDIFSSPALGAWSEGVAVNQTAAGLLVDSQAVMMSAAVAQRLGLTVGEHFNARIGGQQRSLYLLQTWDSDGWAEDWLLSDIGAAQQWLAQTGWLDRVLFKPRTPEDVAQLRQLLPATASLVENRDRQDSRRMSGAFYLNLQAMGFLAWLLGLFLAYGAYATISRQRWKEFSDWRRLGVTGEELRRLLWAEAALLGLLGGLLGVVAGRLAAQQMLPLVTHAATTLYGGATAVAVSANSQWPLALLGIVAAMAAALPTAAHLRHEGPLALRRRAHGETVATGWRWSAWAGLFCLTLPPLLLWLRPGAALAPQIPGFAALTALMMGFALLVPGALRVLLRLLPGRSRPVRALLRDHLHRQGVAQAGLVLALAAGLGIGLMVQSFRQSVDDWLGQVLWADVYLSVPAGEAATPFTAEVLERLAALPGVTEVGGVRRADVLLDDGSQVELLAYQMSPQALAQLPLFAGAHVDAHERWQSGQGVLVNEVLARARGWQVGDQLTLLADGRQLCLPVVGINADYSADAGALVLPWSYYRGWFNDAYLDAVGLSAADAELTADAAIRRQLPAATDIRYTRQKEIYQRSLAVFDQTFAVTRAGRGLLLLIALVAVAGAMSAMIIAQQPWLATLRAMGMTPRGLSGLILEQGLTLGLLASVLALPLGMLVSWLLSHDIMRVSFGWLLPMNINLMELLALPLQGALVALLASVYPAWRGRRQWLPGGGE